MEYYHFHGKDKHLWNSLLQKSENAVRVRTQLNFDSDLRRRKTKKPFTKLSANGFLGFKSYIIWCLGPDSNRHGVTTEGF